MAILRNVLRFWGSEEGATATEYAIMLALIILVAIGAVLFLGQTVEGLFNDFGSLVAPYFGGS